MTEQPRRFPPPSEIEDNGAGFIVGGHSGQALAYLYYEKRAGSPSRRRSADAR
jgi:hypothetical protein